MTEGSDWRPRRTGRGPAGLLRWRLRAAAAAGTAAAGQLASELGPVPVPPGPATVPLTAPGRVSRRRRGRRAGPGTGVYKYQGRSLPGDSAWLHTGRRSLAALEASGLSSEVALKGLVDSDSKVESESPDGGPETQARIDGPRADSD